VGRKQEKLDAVAREIAHDGGSCETASFDIRDEEAVAAAIAEMAARHGRIHGLVNNAGGQFPAEVADISKKGWDAVIATNLTGGWQMMRTVFNASMKQHGGAIVNITADMHRGMPGMAHSGAARAGMANLTQTAAFEWGKHGVRVNAVAPGWIASSGMDTYGGSARAMIPYLKQHLPAQRLGSEAEVSAAVTFLLSPAAAFITGVQLQVDGGAPVGRVATGRWKTTTSRRFSTVSTARWSRRCCAVRRRRCLSLKSKINPASDDFKAAAAAIWRRSWVRSRRLKPRCAPIPPPRNPALKSVVSCCPASGWRAWSTAMQPFVEIAPLAGWKMHDDDGGRGASGRRGCRRRRRGQRQTLRRRRQRQRH
jgi:citronellol/citronellal dehydrogenase